MNIFVDQAGNLNIANIALAMFLTSALVAAVFGLGWKRANSRREGLQRALVEKRMLLADASDRLLLEEQTAAQLNDALNAANDIIARKDYELQVAQEKIASLNGENDTVYKEYLSAQKELALSVVELKYWQYFTGKALHNGGYYLEKVDLLLKDAIRFPSTTMLASIVEPLESALELLDLAETSDLPQRIRDMRADGTRTTIHLLPRLRAFVEEWEKTLGSRFSANVPLTEKAILFAGSWVHLELVLTTMISNAIKHGVESSSIEFEFSSVNRMATFRITNRSPKPVPESVIRAKNEMAMGDIQKPRFGLYLLDQIATGYRAIVKIENLGLSIDGVNHLVRASFAVALR